MSYSGRSGKQCLHGTFLTTVMSPVGLCMVWKFGCSKTTLDLGTLVRISANRTAAENCKSWAVEPLQRCRKWLSHSCSRTRVKLSVTTRSLEDFSPGCSMYGIFTYIYPKNCPNVGKYSIHGSSGYGLKHAKTRLRRISKKTSIAMWKIARW